MMKEIFTKKFLMMILVLLGIFAIGITIQNLMNPQQFPKLTKSQIADFEKMRFKTQDEASEAVKEKLFKGVKESSLSLASHEGTPGIGIHAFYDGKTKDYVTTYYVIKNKADYQVKIGKVNVMYQKGDKKMWTDNIDGHQYDCYINDYRRFRDDIAKEGTTSTAPLHNDGAIHIVQKK
ncbi:hypothetical protein [Macrococcus capreoli]|uniref:hypothetical protein n=2 Tax=Macrococcus capreoli TaxID=2982690 RepID=UPI003F4365EF